MSITEHESDPDMKCSECGSIEALARCVGCGGAVCPQHRGGTGDLSDGYACLSGPCVMQVFMGIPRQASAISDVSHLRVRHGVSHRREIAMFAIVILLLCCAVVAVSWFL